MFQRCWVEGFVRKQYYKWPVYAFWIVSYSLYSLCFHHIAFYHVILYYIAFYLISLYSLFLKNVLSSYMSITTSLQNLVYIYTHVLLLC